MKAISFLRASGGLEREAFQDWMFETASGTLLREVSGLRGLVLNRLIDPPPSHPRRDYEDPDSGRPYDVVAEFWTDSDDDYARVLAVMNGHGLDRRADRVHSYRVSETTIVDRLRRSQAGVTPGIKYIGRLLFHEDLGTSAMRRSWAAHGDLAPRMFVDLLKYLQNFVEAPLDGDPPPTNAIPQLYFPSFEGAVNMVPGGREQIMQDLRHFLKSGARLYAHEHVIKPA